MNQAVKKLWLEALTDGSYEQATEWLRRGKTGYCCLGVLCDLHRLQTEEGYWNLQGGYTTEGALDYATLSVAVMCWSGVNMEHIIKLSCMNDSGYSFKRIAEYIEKDFPDEAEIELLTRETVLV